MNPYLVIKRPLVTEKVSMAKELGNQYAFEVSKDATKPQVKKAVETLFKVKVLKVRTIKVHGKTKRVGKTFKYRRTPDWKKAMVKLREGDKIEFFEGV